MNLEEKANNANAYNVFGKGGEKSVAFNDGFLSGYNECKTDLIEFLKVNYKASVKDILKHLENLV